MYILASDFDGTLNRAGGVSELDREAIARFRAAGNRFGVVTGRHLDMYDALQNIGLQVDFVIAFNGAAAVDEHRNLLFMDEWENKVLPDGRTFLRTVAEYLYGGFGTFLCACYGEERHTYCDETPFVPWVRGEEPVRNADLFPRLTHLNTQFHTDEEAAAQAVMMKEKFGDVINPLQNGVCVDMPPRGVDKGSGIARYAKLIGADENNIYTAGDNVNDLAMITRFHGCAVDNARDEVKAAASEGVFAGIYAMIDKILSL